MEKRAIEASQERLKIAAGHLKDLENCELVNLEALRFWELFLAELTRSFNKIFHGEQIGHPCCAITRRIRDDRKNDPLLAYLREARDDLDHGIEKVAKVVGKGRPLEASEAVPMASFTIRNSEGDLVTQHATRESTLIMDSFMMCLSPVRSGQSLRNLPNEHLGIPIDDTSPSGIGKVAIKYVEERLEEIRALAV